MSLCSYHTTARRSGRLTRHNALALNRILSSVIDPETGCWEWQGATTVGYGRVKIGGRSVLTHRVAYELLVGELVPGMCIDHQCMNRRCVNPDHLEQVSYAVNMRRAWIVRTGTAPHVVTRTIAGSPYIQRLAAAGVLDEIDAVNEAIAAGDNPLGPISIDDLLVQLQAVAS